MTVRQFKDVPSRGATVTLLLVSTLTIMAGATISPALPGIQAHFAGVSDVELLVGLLLTIPAAAIGVTAPIAGLLSDRVGRRTMLAGAVLLYAIAGTSGLWLESLPGLLVGRVALGVAVGAVMATSTALIGDLFQGAERSRIIGWQAASTSFGGVVFLVGGGFLADMDWRGPFAVYGLALLLLPLVIIALPAVGRGAPADDVAEAPGGTVSWATVAFYAVLAASAGVAFYLIPARLPFRLIEAGIDGGLRAGAAIGATVFASGFASLAARRLANLLPAPVVIALGFGLLGGGLAGVGWFGTYPGILAALIVVGCGTGVIQPTLTGLALSTATAATRGRVAGVMTAAIFFGQFASPFASAPFEAGWGLPAAYLAAGAACGIVGLALLIRSRGTAR